MRSLFLIAVVLTAYAFGSQVLAQATAKNAESSPPSNEQKSTSSYPLTDKQKAEWAQFQQDERQQAQVLQAIVMNALNVEVGPTTSILFHTQIREAQLKLGSLQAQKAAWLAQLRLESNCKDCVIEGDRLAKPK